MLKDGARYVVDVHTLVGNKSKVGRNMWANYSKRRTNLTPNHALIVIPVGVGFDGSTVMSMTMRNDLMARVTSPAVYAVSAAWRT